MPADLSPDQSYIAMRVSEGASYAEIADEMDTSPEVVKVQASKARARGADVPAQPKGPPPTRREAILALKKKGLTTAQIAERLGVSRGNVASQLTRLRQAGRLGLFLSGGAAALALSDEASAADRAPASARDTAPGPGAQLADLLDGIYEGSGYGPGYRGEEFEPRNRLQAVYQVLGEADREVGRDVDLPRFGEAFLGATPAQTRAGAHLANLLAGEVETAAAHPFGYVSLLGAPGARPAGRAVGRAARVAGDLSVMAAARIGAARNRAHNTIDDVMYGRAPAKRRPDRVLTPTDASVEERSARVMDRELDRRIPQVDPAGPGAAWNEAQILKELASTNRRTRERALAKIEEGAMADGSVGVPVVIDPTYSAAEMRRGSAVLEKEARERALAEGREFEEIPWWAIRRGHGVRTAAKMRDARAGTDRQAKAAALADYRETRDALSTGPEGLRRGERTPEAEIAEAERLVRLADRIGRRYNARLARDGVVGGAEAGAYIGAPVLALNELGERSARADREFYDEAGDYIARRDGTRLDPRERVAAASDAELSEMLGDGWDAIRRAGALSDVDVERARQIETIARQAVSSGVESLRPAERTLYASIRAMPPSDRVAFGVAGDSGELDDPAAMRDLLDSVYGRAAYESPGDTPRVEIGRFEAPFTGGVYRQTTDRSADERDRAAQTTTTPDRPSAFVRPDDNYADILDLQVALQVAGLYHGALDGRAGPQTQAALVDLQRTSGRSYDVSSSASREAARRDANRLHPEFDDLGDLTRYTQRLLQLSGYDPGPVDGAWGERTTRAYNSARRSIGLTTVSPDWRPQTVEDAEDMFGAIAGRLGDRNAE